VIDGPDYFSKAIRLVSPSDKVQVTATPENTGGAGFYGHRIYSAYPHLLSSDYIFFLDEDNWFQPDHVKTLVQTIEEQNLDFAYSLRSVHNPDRSFAVDDNCEALGKWPIYFTNDKPEKHYLVDTSSYAFRREFLIQVCQLWHSGWGGDRRFFNLVREQTKHNTSGKRTLCYRLDGNEGSVTADFFKKGNEYYNNFYKGEYPWLKI
jgi:glycosyltransferase involved in cell wall biosynthesis